MKKLFVIIYLIFCSCGYYSFSGSNLPAHLKTIAIPTFDDRTSEYGVREALTDALIEKFTDENSLKIENVRNADSILEGTILRINDQAGAYSADEEVKDIKISITVEVKFRDLKKREIIWEETITQMGNYDPADADGREAGIEAAIKILVTDILNKTTAGW